MNATTIRAVIGTLLLLAAFCAAGDPQTRPSAANEEKEIKSLIAQFSSDDPQIRGHAQKVLIQIGVAAKPFLEAALRSDDPDVATRAELTLQMIDDPTSPTYVSVDVKDTAASVVIHSLEAQAHEPLLVYQQSAQQRIAATNLTIHAIHEPFWAVLLQVCEAVDLRPDCYMPERGGWSLREDAGTWDDRNTTIRGPFAVHVASISRQAQRNFANPARRNFERTTIGAFCHAEKKTHAQAIQNLRVTRCEDENGKPIGAFGRIGLNSFSFQGYATFDITLNSASAKKISLLEGDVEFVLEAGREHIEVNDLLHAANVQRTPGPIRLAVRDCRSTADKRWAVRITVHRDGRDQPAWASLLNQLRNSPPRVEDSQGRPLMNWGETSSKPDGETTEIEYFYGNFVNYGRGIPTDPVKLIWDVPTRTQSVSVPFHFVEIPIP